MAQFWWGLWWAHTESDGAKLQTIKTFILNDRGPENVKKTRKAEHSRDYASWLQGLLSNATDNVDHKNPYKRVIGTRKQTLPMSRIAHLLGQFEYWTKTQETTAHHHYHTFVIYCHSFGAVKTKNWPAEDVHRFTIASNRNSQQPQCRLGASTSE